MRGLNTASQLVDFCKQNAMFRQVDQKKFLNATTTRRCYYNLTKSEVERLTPKALLRQRTVKTLDGNFYSSGS